MVNLLKGKFALLAITSLLGLSLTGCSLSSGYGESGASAAPATNAQPAASPNSDMPNMEMPQKPASSEMKETSASIPNQVVIENFSFVPATLTVKSGTKVIWVNRDDVPHTATDIDKRFNSSTLDTDDQFSFEFSRPGTYDYYCALHPKMTGKIIVK